MYPRGLSTPVPGLYTCMWPPFSKLFFSTTAWPIKAKVHVEPPWEGEKVYINGPGHMTKMAATPIYGKNPIKNLLLQKSYDLETWHAHYVLKLYKVYINDDPELTLTHFKICQIWRNLFLYL